MGAKCIAQNCKAKSDHSQDNVDQCHRRQEGIYRERVGNDMAGIPPPILQALVLADHIYTDQSGKRIICGTFSKIWSTVFPSVFSRPTWVFILLADVFGKVELRLRFVNLKDDQILMESASVFLENKEDRLTPMDIAIQIPGFPLPEPGAYSFECYADNRLLGSVRLRVEQVAEPEGSENV